MTDTINIRNKIVELNNSNDIYMLMNMCILSNDVNYNKAKFTEEFINNVIENKDKYIGLPLQVNRDKLENAEYENLTHELQDGELKTDSVGSFVDYWSEEIDGALCLMGSVKVYKRYPNTCNAILELYENDELESSCEVLVKEYKEIQDDGVRVIDYAEGDNSFIASCLVTDPAERRAKATLLIAEAYQKDLEIESKEGNKTLSKTETFNKGKEIKYHGKLEVNSLKYSDVASQIYNSLNPINPKTEYRDYNYMIHELYVDHVIAEDWDDYEVLYKIPYSIQDDTVILSDESEWQEGRLGFIPSGMEINQFIMSQKEKVDGLNKEINQLKEDKEIMSKELETKVTELNEQIEKLTTDLESANELVVSEQEGKKELEDKVAELNSTIEELQTYKDKYETAQKEAKQKELSEKYSKLLSEKTFKSEDVQNAIEACDASKLNEIVVAEVAETKKTETASNKNNEDVTITASKQDDLVPQDKHEFWSSPRS